MATISKFIADNHCRLVKDRDAILSFFLEIQKDSMLLHDYENLKEGSTSRSVNSQIGRRICAILEGKAVGRKHAVGTKLIESYSQLSFNQGE